MSTRGTGATARSVYAHIPASKSAAARRDVAIGRRMNGAETFTGPGLRPLPVGAVVRARSAPSHVALDAVHVPPYRLLEEAMDLKCRG